MLTIYICRPLSVPLLKTLSWHTVLTPAIILWRMHRNPPCSFISNDQTPNISIPLFCVVGFLDSVSDSCHIISHYVFSSPLESIVLSLPSCCQPFHLFRLHLCNTHSSLPIFLIFFIASLSFIFDPFSSMGHWSFWLSPCSLLSSLLLNSPISPLYLASPFSSVFLASALCSLKNIKKSLSRSFLLLSWPGLCLIAFSLSVFLSALQIIQLGRLPGYTKPLPARWHS